MTNDERKAAILDLAKELNAEDTRDVSMDLEDLAEDKAKLECEQNGHQIDNDHCGRPEHRFCYHCHQRETEIEQARQGKGDEPAASKVAVPSESLGSGSKSFFARLFQ